MEVQTTPYRYGITERKKADLDALAIQILDAEAEVQQQTAIVQSLVVKSEMFNDYLMTTEANRAKALSNKKMIDEIVEDARALNGNSNAAFKTITNAEDKLRYIATQTKNLVNKLIFSVEMINKLSSKIVQEKLTNELTSDELVNKVSTLNTDANNAVALALLSLKSIFATHAVGLEAQTAITLEHMEAEMLYRMLSDKEIESLRTMLHQAYSEAKSIYHQIDEANNVTRRQLNMANADLSKVTIKLASLQAGLAAANAAAFA